METRVRERHQEDKQKKSPSLQKKIRRIPGKKYSLLQEFRRLPGFNLLDWNILVKNGRPGLGSYACGARCRVSPSALPGIGNWVERHSCGVFFFCAESGFVWRFFSCDAKENAPCGSSDLCALFRGLPIMDLLVC